MNLFINVDLYKVLNKQNLIIELIINIYYQITSDIVNLVETYIDTYEKNEKHIKDKKIKLKSYET